MEMLVNASEILSNRTGGNGTWLTHEEVEHFLGDPDVDHAIALVLGVLAIVYGRRLPQLLAAVASVSLGLWTGLVVQDRQSYDTPLVGNVKIPDGTWVPILAGILTGVAAAVLCKVAWRSALVLLTSGLLMLLALAICRLANTSPEHIFKVGVSALSAYRIVGAVVLVAAVLASALAVKKFHEHMITFASAQLGTLLLLSGVSHFASRVGSNAPFSLLDDLARIISEVRGGRCQLWEGDEAHNLESCDCTEQCRSEICAWLASSVAVLVLRCVQEKVLQRRDARLKKASEEERAPLSKCGASPAAAVSGTPSPEAIGASAI